MDFKKEVYMNPFLITMLEVNISIFKKDIDRANKLFEENER